MKVCLFGGQHTTVLPTVQPVHASPAGNNSLCFQELSNHSLQIPLGSDNRPCIAKAYGAQALGSLLSKLGKWTVFVGRYCKLLSMEFIWIPTEQKCIRSFEGFFLTFWWHGWDWESVRKLTSRETRKGSGACWEQEAAWREVTYTLNPTCGYSWHQLSQVITSGHHITTWGLGLPLTISFITDYCDNYFQE